MIHTLIIIATLAVIFAGLLTYFGIRDNKHVDYKSNILHRCEGDEMTDKFMQELEDDKFKLNIELEARRNFTEHINDRIVLFNPPPSVYIVYDESTAKYINADFRKLCLEKFTEIKEQYLKDYHQ